MQYLSMTDNDLEIGGNYRNIIKVIYEIFIANNILKSERLKNFLLKLGSKKRCFLLLL